MGWSSWNTFFEYINEDLIKDQAKALVDTGLADKGYTYVNIDDGYFGGRDEDGVLIWDSSKFPNGLKPVSDYIHSLGLKAGIYSDGGDNTCCYTYGHVGDNGKGVGLYGHEEEDLRRFFLDNDFDFIKVDWCGGLRLGLDEEEQYSKISQIIDKIAEEKGEDIIFNVCRWMFPGEWIMTTADSWRIGSDIIPQFGSVLYELDSAKPLLRFNGPGHYNDLDMLQVGNGMSYDEDVSHFIMWCMMSTPLLIGADVRKLGQETLDLLGNEELIALNQDSASLPAYVIKNGVDDNGKLSYEVWMKDLGEENSTEKALAFLNRGEEPLTVELDLSEAGLEGEIENIRDLMIHTDLPISDHLSIDLRPHQTVVLKVKATESRPVENLNKQFSFTPSPVKKIDYKAAMDKIENGALLIDVRTKDEFEKGHLEGATNIEFHNFDSIPSKYPDDLEQELILYCRTGKRAEEVAQILEYYGYNNVYSLGGILNLER